MSAVLPGISTNLRAFLDAIAYGEGTSTSPATRRDGYDVIVTGADGKPEIFTDFSAHPFSRGRPAKLIRPGLHSTASGRYQFMFRDYFAYRDMLDLPDFGPESQDRWAIQLIRERRALPLIEAGKFAAAVARVCNLWASLPGANYGQPVRKLAALQGAYTNAGGVVS
ncbi:MAG: glycoside hydrolase family 24 protein [Burkholderiaceae bacterium]